ncbi:CshA/CshB family fibrillar adhesin-related protein, partial [Mucilaginibacter puniceus]
MNKRLLLKVFLLFALFFQLVNKASAQYAVTGTASTNLQKSIYWLTWKPGSFGMSTTLSSSGATEANIKAGTYEWQYSPTVKITATISNLSFPGAGSQMPAYTPGSFFGDGLDVLYNGNGINGKALNDNANTNDPVNTYSRGIPFSGIGTQNGQASHPSVKFDIAISVQILINGVYQSVNYPGMVIADAESIGWITTPTSESEYFSGTTNGNTAWQLLNLRLDGTAKNDGYLLDLANNGKDFKIYISGSTKSDPGAQAVMYAHGATSLTNVTMKGNGRTAAAIGFILPFDLGDAPNPLTGNSYGRPESYINDFTFTSKPINNGNDGTGIVLKDVANPGGVLGAGLSGIVPKAKAYMGANLGANNVDADGLPTGSVFTAGATADDANQVDEDAISPAAIANLNIKVNRANDVTVTVPSITNTEAVAVNLDGWIDFNNDGKFDAAERANTVSIAANSTANNTNLVFPKSKFGATASTIQFGSTTYMRLRLSKDALTDYNLGTAYDDASISSAADGEIEDYQLNNLTGVIISGNVLNDNNGAADNVISGTAHTTIPLFAYLADNTGAILQKVNVTGGAYTFSQVNNGTYKVAISTVNATLPANISTTPANLPIGWAPSADGYGTFNSANPTPLGNGIESGTPDFQIIVTPEISGNGNNVANVNFGINATPVANNDLGTPANTNTATTKNLTTNDTDTDGTIDVTSVVIENPATPGTYATTGFTVANEGTYTLNAATGVVTFTSLGEFVGTTTPINYKVKDNFGSFSNIGIFSFTVKIGGVTDPIETAMNTPISYNVKANDGTAANTGTVTVTPQSGATANGGSVVTDPQDATKLKYTPANNFIGIDTYTYTLTKNSVTSSDITVTVTVKPKGSDDSDETTQGVAKETDVLFNDLTNTGV